MSHRRRQPAATGYLERSQQPLQSLLFLLPMLIAYEVGTHLYATDPERGVVSWIRARSLLRDFFKWFGPPAYYLPALIVVVVLLSWHFVRRDPWRFELKLYLVMALESIILAIPLFVFGLVIARSPAAMVLLQNLAVSPSGVGESTWQAALVFSIGAGIYEELLFRLIGIALLHLILVDVLALPDHIGAIGAIGGSAVAFALYHFTGDEPFHLGLAAYYTGAGIYFAGIYVWRGFGIVAATHALYDVYATLLILYQQS